MNVNWSLRARVPNALDCDIVVPTFGVKVASIAERPCNIDRYRRGLVVAVEPRAVRDAECVRAVNLCIT